MFVFKSPLSYYTLERVGNTVGKKNASNPHSPTMFSKAVFFHCLKQITSFEKTQEVSFSLLIIFVSKLTNTCKMECNESSISDCLTRCIFMSSSQELEVAGLIPGLGQYYSRRLMIVIGIGFIPTALLFIVSTVVMLESSQ